MPEPSAATPERGTVLIANPSSDVYGSDLQMLESISALVEAGYRVVVTTPDDGPLVPQMEDRGAVVLRADYPVLRRENASAGGILKLALTALRAIPTMLRILRAQRPVAVYVNTVTLPWWLVASRLARVPTICHVHEAEGGDGRAVRTALNGPLVLADEIIVISPSSLDAVCDTVGFLRRRCHMIFNGVPGPEEEPSPSVPGPGPRRLAVIGRLSPRKGTDVALDAVGLLRAGGRDVQLEVCGTAFAGYEWFVQQLHERAARPDLEGAVTFSGYVRPVWPVLARAEVVLAPSLREPFGNAVVEAQLAARPVVAAAAMGHLETVLDGETGLLAPPGDAQAMADAAARFLDDPVLAERIAVRARERAGERFSLERYRAEVAQLVGSIARSPSGSARG